jgi:hypothetical protein
MVKQTTLFTSSAPGFYNTTNLKDDELKEKKEKVVGQNGEILHYFAMNPHQKFTPWDIYEKMKGKAPITSVRRGITTLEIKGYLQKTNDKVRCGPWKDFSFQWQLQPDKKVTQ